MERNTSDPSPIPETLPTEQVLVLEVGEDAEAREYIEPDTEILEGLKTLSMALENATGEDKKQKSREDFEEALEDAADVWLRTNEPDELNRRIAAARKPVAKGSGVSESYRDRALDAQRQATSYLRELYDGAAGHILGLLETSDD